MPLVKSPDELLAAVRPACEQWLHVFSGFAASRVPQGWPGEGTPFVEMWNGRIRQEGEPADRLPTRGEAVKAFTLGFRRYREEHPGNAVLWRVEPRWFLDCEGGGYAIRARFALATVSEDHLTALEAA